VKMQIVQRCKLFSGLLALVASATILAGMYYLKLGVFEMVSKHFVQIAVVGMLLGILFGVISHVAARRLHPKHMSHSANTGQYRLAVILLQICTSLSVTSICQYLYSCESFLNL